MSDLEARIEADVAELTAHPDRHVGGPGNDAANEMVATRLAGLGFDVRRTGFDCLEWEHGEAFVEVGGERFDLHVGPYSPPCVTHATLIEVRDIEHLEKSVIAGAVVLLTNEIAAHQVMPKNFPFYNPEEHRRIVAALEHFGPAAVIAATGRDPEMVGGQYPFPLFEDGDLDIPNAYMTAEDGKALRKFDGDLVRIRIESRRLPATAEQVVATLPGDRPGRIVVTAHIDSRRGSPGGLDNASGVATLLTLAGLLAGYEHGPTIEIVPFNGEDDYAAHGEILWLAENEGAMDDIELGINIDDLGWRGTVNHVSLYACPPEVEASVRGALDSFPDMAEGPQWFQSDHAIFGIHGRPAIALATSDIAGFMADYAHSEKDTADLADPALIAGAARFVRDVIGRVASA
ncbi:MAG: M28 family peptidase [Actinomycetota bacterium]|nr:M28 family peptidase [Actinomycetota bacterium]